ETDAPYLAPHPYRGKENRPVYIPLIVAKMAELRGTDQTILAKTIMNNARKLFKI
ncbi:MAG TPA: TatD family hydrolase, partial [Bacilli bacterium]|nr:TatD family hydrolase [Bacilli bacterium]